MMMRQTPVYAGAGAIHKLQGDALRLDCLVDGSPQPTIVWFKVRREERGQKYRIAVREWIWQPSRRDDDDDASHRSNSPAG